ncbi:FUSC family protein [Streptomyces sp. NPDC035033]|uniref:FUSC family protein n=1 Tax=Streptomyces sp. NPDC035033 TaxID=3155368 RepID=UPI00340F00DE
MALPAVPMALAGHADQAVHAMLGSFTTTFGRNLPYPRRARVLALVAVAMTACVGGGSLLGAWAEPQHGGAGAVAVVAAVALVAGAAKLACDAARLGGLGAVLLLFSFAVAANGSPGPSDVLPRTAAAALGAVVACVLAVAGRFVHPDRPQRLAVAAALRDVAALLDADGPAGAGGSALPAGPGPRGPYHPPTGRARSAGRPRGPLRHRATAAVLQAYRTLGTLPPTATERGRRGDSCLRLTDLAWSQLVGPARRPPDETAAMARNLRRQARLLLSRRLRAPRVLPELSLPSLPDRARTAATGRSASGTRPTPTSRRAAELRAAELLTGPRHDGRLHRAVLFVPALRMVLGTGAAGAAALLLGLGHGYWAAISAAAVLHSVNVRTATVRAVQRTLGTVAGLLLALAVLALHPGPLTLVLVIVLLEFLLEYAVARNYGLGVVFLTPLALLLTALEAPSPSGTLVQDRALGSLLGIVIALGCALLVVHDRAAVRVDHALAACTKASDRAERALEARSEELYPLVQTRLAAAAVELREADDAAAGELWQAEIDPVEPAAAEHRAYLLLERLLARPAPPTPPG